MEILGGLSDGEQVIVANQASFHTGEMVTPKLSAMANANPTEAQ
jgi:hypothetical protein